DHDPGANLDGDGKQHACPACSTPPRSRRAGPQSGCSCCFDPLACRHARAQPQCPAYGKDLAMIRLLGRLARRPLAGPRPSAPVLLLALAAGRITPPPKYYLLHASAPSRPAAATAAVPRRTLAINPVALPEYLNRIEIVSRSEGNSLTVSDNDKWGERLQS